MENYLNPANWPFFDQKTPRPLIAPRGNIVPESERQTIPIESATRFLAEPQTPVSINYLPGTRPVDEKVNNMSYHITRGDSFHDKNYLDLGMIITEPLVIYENDSPEIKDAVKKFCKLAKDIQAAQTSLENAWVDFLGVKNRDDLVQKTWAIPENVGPAHSRYAMMLQTAHIAEELTPLANGWQRRVQHACNWTAIQVTSSIVVSMR